MAFITTNQLGGLLSDTDANEIIKELPQQSAALQMFRTIRMPKKTHKMPVTTGLATAYFVSGPSGTSQPGRKRTSTASWDKKTLTAEELAVIVAVPEEQLDDADFDLWGEVRPQVVEAMGAKIDGAVFFGVDKPSGWSDDAIVPAARTAGNSFVRGSVAQQRLDVDISDTMSLVESDGFEVNGFAADLTLRGGLRGLRDADGQPIYITTPRTDGVGGQQAAIYGQDAQFVRNGAWDRDEAVLVAGDYNKAILAIRQDINWRVFREGVIQNLDSGAIEQNLMQDDMVAIRFTFRLAWAVANPVTRMNENNATRYPFAVLRPSGASA